MKPDKVLYVAHAVATGGRDGRATTDSKSLDVTLSVPKELGGGGGEGTNPEQLFACGYAACFLGAMKAVAAREKIRVPPEVTVRASVGIGPSGSAFALDVALEVSYPGLEREQAQALVEKAHAVCPYSNATRGNVDVRLSVVS